MQFTDDISSFLILPHNIKLLFKLLYDNIDNEKIEV